MPILWAFPRLNKVFTTGDIVTQLFTEFATFR